MVVFCLLLIFNIVEQPNGDNSAGGSIKLMMKELATFDPKEKNVTKDMLPKDKTCIQ